MNSPSISVSEFPASLRVSANVGRPMPIVNVPRARRNDRESRRLSSQIYNDIDALDTVAWNAFVSRAAVGLEVPHLRAVERARVSDVDNYYLVAFLGEQPIGVAHF